MLFFLTGEIQTGKTRWLQALCDKACQRGAQVCGVVAPGIWAKHVGAPTDEGRFEKTGIENVLLPDGERIPFAIRRDLAQTAGSAEGESQAGRLQLGWAIDDAAIARVDAHLTGIAAQTADAAPARRLLVIDEFGRLELHAGEGLVSGVSLIDRGAVPALPHALVVVREQLLSDAIERFEAAPWHGMQPIAPGAIAEQRILDALDVNNSGVSRGRGI